MKITKSILQRVIQEELQAVLQETGPYQDQHPGSGCDPSVQTCVGPSVELGSEYDYGGKTADVVRSYQAGQSRDMASHSNQTLTGDFQTLLARAGEAGGAMDPGLKQHMYDLGQELLNRGYPANLVNAQYETFGVGQQPYKMRLRKIPGHPHAEEAWDQIQEGQKEKYLAKLVREELAAALQEEENNEEAAEEVAATKAVPAKKAAPRKVPELVTSHPPLGDIKDAPPPKFPPDYQKSTQAPVKRRPDLIPRDLYKKDGKNYAVLSTSKLEKAFPRGQYERTGAYKLRVHNQIRKQERRR